MLDFVSPDTGELLRREGNFLISKNGDRFPIINNIPRFVASDNYAASFGLQWNEHRLTQLDSFSGTKISQQRLERCLGMPIKELTGRLILEAGCGAGRFTELMVKAGALVHAIDLSHAVEANKKNIGEKPNYSISQADFLAPPFPHRSFDLVVCLGVLQHLPSPENGISSLWAMLKPGGLMVIDHYTWTLSAVTKLSWFYRIILKRMSPRKAKKVTDKLTAFFFPLHWAVRRFYLLQMLLSRVSPCLVYFRNHPELSKEQHYEFCRLDTFDHLTDYYKHLKTAGQIRRFLISIHAEDVWVSRGGNGIEARCRKSSHLP